MAANLTPFIARLKNLFGESLPLFVPRVSLKVSDLPGISLENRYKNVRVLTANFWSAIRSAERLVSLNERHRSSGHAEQRVERTSVRSFVEFCSDPLNRELLEQEDSCAEVQSEEDLGDGAGDAFTAVACV